MKRKKSVKISKQVNKSSNSGVMFKIRPTENFTHRIACALCALENLTMTIERERRTLGIWSLEDQIPGERLESRGMRLFRHLIGIFKGTTEAVSR